MKPNQELIESLAAEYAERYDGRYQIIAKQAYIDGVLAVLEDILRD